MNSKVLDKALIFAVVNSVQVIPDSIRIVSMNTNCSETRVKYFPWRAQVLRSKLQRDSERQFVSSVRSLIIVSFWKHLSDASWNTTCNFSSHVDTKLSIFVRVKYHIREHVSSDPYYRWLNYGDGSFHELLRNKTVSQTYRYCQQDFRHPMRSDP